MRKLFTLCLLVFSLSASAQWQQTGSKVRYVNGIGIPTRDTAAGVAADSSQILIRPADSSLYVKYKRTWLRVGGGGGSIAGSGTTNYIPKFTSSTAIGNSSIFDNGNVGIGTTSPTQTLTVNGNSAVGGQQAFWWRDDDGFSGSSTRRAWAATANYDVFGVWSLKVSNAAAGNPLTAGTNVINATAAGDVGIGTTSPAGRFVVADGQTLLGTNTNNGTDRLQVSGSTLITAGLQAATTSGNVSLRTTATTYPFNISLGANAGIGMYQDGTTATLIGTNQTVSATAPMQILGTTLTLNASGNNNAQIFTNSNERLRVNGTGNVIVDPTQLGTKLLVNTTTDAGTDKVQVAGSISAEGFKQRYLARTTAYTATTGDYLIDCTTGTFTVTLYAASGNAGRILIVKNSGTGSITVDGNGAETIDGAATQTLGTQWSRISIMCDGTNWKIISN